jgi:hypothetical protein
MIHVKGHQDAGNTNRRLPLLARLNVQADKLATSFQRHTHHRGDAVPCIGGNYAQLHATPPHIKSHEDLVNTVTITRKIRNTLRSFYGTRRIREHVQRKMKWSMNSVDWESLGTSISKSSEMKTFVTKLHHDLLPTGRRVHRYQAYYEKSCPSCRHEDEDQAHLFHCTDTRREEWRVQQFVKSVSTKCRSMRVYPNITKLLTQGIESFLFDTTFPAYEDEVPPRLRLLAEEQRAIARMASTHPWLLVNAVGATTTDLQRIQS